MAPKDYVSRGRVAKKPKAVEKPQIPWIRLILTVGLVAGFGYFLWSIKDRAPEPTPQPVELADTDTQSDSDPLPELPKGEFGYPEWLEDYTVEVEDKQQTLSDKRYLMQCGSFKTETQAEEMRARIAFQGLEAQVRASDGKNGRWYRVILGPYDQKREAEKDRHTLRRNKMTSCKIWFWNL